MKMIFTKMCLIYSAAFFSVSGLSKLDDNNRQEEWAEKSAPVKIYGQKYYEAHGFSSSVANYMARVESRAADEHKAYREANPAPQASKHFIKGATKYTRNTGLACLGLSAVSAGIAGAGAIASRRRNKRARRPVFKFDRS